MQTVFDVLESQGRSALLPDAVISAFLGQLTVNITYEPLECKDGCFQSYGGYAKMMPAGPAGAAGQAMKCNEATQSGLFLRGT
ncbi:hypothetical protein KIN20_031855 [Parelaphostrongylus tenuis]|uniref:Uncharacterized protein n=1 Tax=Parelaphostrongylus tenuis TaxID=148309 RepID=A0AAD5R628_PARTN|nr:hypothetical protein KIN20_031855 [Parelaphostrongylus tenuis]